MKGCETMCLTPGKHRTHLVEAQVHSHTRNKAVATDTQCVVSICKCASQEEGRMPDMGGTD